MKSKPSFELQGRLLIVFDPILAKKVNRILKRYPPRTRFQYGEEPLFYTLGCKSSNAALMRLIGPLLGSKPSSNTEMAAS
jgi:hypothetical protein